MMAVMYKLKRQKSFPLGHDETTNIEKKPIQRFIRSDCAKVLSIENFLKEIWMLVNIGL